MSDPMEAWLVSVCRKLGVPETPEGAAASGSTGSGAKSGTAAPAAPTAGAVTPEGAGADPAPTAPAAAVIPAVAGEDAKAQADAAEARARAIETALSAVRPYETEVETIAAAAAAEVEAAEAARAEADESILAMGEAAAVAAPTGDDARAQYDDAIRISGTARVAQQDALAGATAARGRAPVIATAVDVAGAKLDAAQDRAKLARASATEASDHAVAAADHAKRAQKAARASKDEAAAAAETDPRRAALAKTAKRDGQHAARAKQAATQAVTAAKESGALAARLEERAQEVAESRDAARAAGEALEGCLVGLDTKLEPFAERIRTAEEQEALHKEKLSEEDARSVLERRFEALGGEPELRRAMAAEDTAVRQRIEAFRGRVRDFDADRGRELDRHEEAADRVIAASEAMLAPLETWFERENPTMWDLVRRANVLGDKLTTTEPGKELMLLARRHMDEMIGIEHGIERTRAHVEETKKIGETLDELRADLFEVTEAAGKFADAKSSELDNELESRAMTLEEKVDYLQTRPTDVRTRIAAELDTRVDEILKGMVADTMAEDALIAKEPETVELREIDWTELQTVVEEVETTDIEVLRAGDPALVALQREYDEAGGDAALLARRLATWKQETAARLAEDKRRTDEFQELIERLQGEVDRAAERADKSRRAVAGLSKAIERAELRLEELSTIEDLTREEIADETLMHREISRRQKELTARVELLEAQERAQTNAERLRDQHEERRENVTREHTAPLPEKPTSKHVTQLPLRAKHAELTGREAAA